MEDQTTTFLSILNQMNIEEVRTRFLDLFTQALAIENVDNEHILLKQDCKEDIDKYYAKA